MEIGKQAVEYRACELSLVLLNLSFKLNKIEATTQNFTCTVK